ncbi:hypothetical protein P153DRAFT_356389 [Dothidotthia symphoricarpi CBS 119687]|uniref:Uncharacterized protein n=1 Tax=Dothidotthia symphoricarpi CBS 119687 TaxID=1392245 RepID=A0A6A6AJQ2_9PLEO|nr:uncharacterized protein P153DRAFT_356389 [Dothidotthia symphoricarpi CBS 119687]KAF2130661.1 hypothetical protein P153DRAFT_356389 [Dothidotthia symphoricarpi CBS 119687]
MSSPHSSPALFTDEVTANSSALPSGLTTWETTALPTQNDTDDVIPKTAQVDTSLMTEQENGIPTAHGGEGSAGDTDEELWISLYHHLLLTLALDKSMPLIDYLNSGVARQFDAFQQGLLDGDGKIVQNPTTRTPEQMLEFEAKCERLVPNLIARIKEASDKNSVWWPETETVDNKTRETHWYFTINELDIQRYRKIRLEEGISGAGENREDYPSLVQFCQLLVEEHYVFPKQVTRAEGEVFDVDTDDNSRQVIAFFKQKNPETDEWYTQVDEIPELHDAEDADQNGTTKPRKFLVPEPLSLLIPPKIKDKLWVYRPSTKDWERADGKIWRPIVVIREFRSDTSKYINTHIDLTKIKDADPNAYLYKRLYNQWVNQIRRRVTKETTMVRDHWTEEERMVLYKAINVWCRKNGLDKFGPNAIQVKALVETADEVNQVLNRSRTPDALKMQINTAIRNKQSPVYLLAEQAKDMKKRIEQSEDVPDKERYPIEGIPLSEGPTTGDKGLQTIDADMDSDLDKEVDEYDVNVEDDDSQATLSPPSSPSEKNH